ncbi:hypothetical protein MTO96_028079 [Rhipicephalus appendiculatus]
MTRKLICLFILGLLFAVSESQRRRFFSEDHVSESVMGPDSHPHPQARARMPAPATAHGMPIGETGAAMAVFVCQTPLFEDPDLCAVSSGTCFSRDECKG